MPLARRLSNSNVPLARRLSNSSHEAFAEFCVENPPLSRRLSVNGDAASIRSSRRRTSISNDKGQRVLKRRQSLTKARVTRSAARKHQIDVSGPEPKKQRITRRRSSITADKENVGGTNQNAGAAVMSPTPYWKVAKERGNKFSPPLTRSAKKKKARHSNGQPNGGVLLFSPPNQAENARREKMEREKKTRER